MQENGAKCTRAPLASWLALPCSSALRRWAVPPERQCIGAPILSQWAARPGFQTLGPPIQSWAPAPEGSSPFSGDHGSETNSPFG